MVTEGAVMGATASQTVVVESRVVDDEVLAMDKGATVEMVERVGMGG